MKNFILQFNQIHLINVIIMQHSERNSYYLHEGLLDEERKQKNEEKNKQKSSIIYRLGFVCKEKIIQKKNHRITLKIHVLESQKQNFSMHIMWSLKLSEHNSPSPFNQNIIFPSNHLLQGKKWKW